jgi:hypothetical protein
MRSIRKLRLLGLGAIAAVVMAIGALAVPASAQALKVPTGGEYDTYPAMRMPMNLAMAPADDPGNDTLTEQLADARQATAKYATNLDQAKADGYQIITMMMPNMGFHFMNPNIHGFNVRKPQILVYEHVGGRWQLGALEWVFPKIPQTPPLANATFGSFPAACHYKDGTFIPDQNANTCPKKASTGAAFTFWHPDLVTMHVWIWYPNPAGLFSGTNPLVAPFNGG